jgi:fermentation-respiration switch protein FrsA (DUF1100 family)
LSSPAQGAVCCTTPADLGHEFENVSIATGSGLTLSGWYIPSQNGAAVILLHGYGDNRGGMVQRAGILADHGYGVLLYDQRASGESEGDWRTFGWADVEDALAALALLEQRADVNPERIGILGFSQGGMIALQTAAKTDQLKAVVAEEPGFATLQDLPPLASFFERWAAFNYKLALKGIEWRTGAKSASSVVDGLPEIAPRPILFLATGTNEEMDYRMPRHYYELAEEPKLWWHVPEAGHGGIPALQPDEYRQRILDFFDDALLQQGNSD